DLANVLMCLAAVLACGCSGSGSTSGDPCEPDVDGVIGGKYRFEVTVSDDAFVPTILKVQNTATVTLELRNEGTTPHGFAVDCIKTPNDIGCPTRSCFPDEAKIDSLGPGDTASVKFAAPRVEGIYVIRSPVENDTQTAQFVVQ